MIREMTHQTRFLSANIDATTVGAVDDRRVAMAISSQEPVERDGYIEVLEHSAAAIDLSWIGSGRAPVLVDHDPKRQVGVVENVSLDPQSGTLRAVVRLGQGAPEAEGILTDIRSGVRCNVSVGYVIHKVERRGDWTIAIRWKPIEVSIVSIPADMTVGVGRSDDASLAHNQRITGIQMTQQTQLTNKDARAIRQETAEILDLGQRHNMRDDAQQFLRDGKTIAEFRQHVLQNLKSGTSLQASIDQSHYSARGFDLGNYIRARVTNDFREAQDEVDISNDLTRSQPGTARGFVVPTSAMLETRAAMTTAGVVASLQATILRDDLYVDALRPGSFAIQAGATFIGGLQSNLVIPRETAGPVASWAAEAAAITENNPVYDQLAMAPKMLTARLSFTRRALLQSLPAMDNMIKRSINRQFAAALDRAAIVGAGTNEPRGIELGIGINSFAAAGAGAVTWAEVVRAWSEIAGDNVSPDDTMAWIVNPVIGRILRATAKFAANGGVPILGDVTSMQDGAILAGQIMGRPAFETAHATATKLTLGKFSDVIIGQWGGIDFVLDETTNASTGVINLYAYGWYDVALRYPNSFCVITGI